MIVAELDLKAPSGLPIVAMETFDKLAPKVDCNADDGKLSLTFKDKNAYDYALGKWSYINENKEDQFLLIANHPGCGPDDERQPYYISSVKDAPHELTVYLSAKEAKWSDVAGDYSLTWGKADPSKHQRLRSRTPKGVVERGIGDANYDHGITFGVSAGTSGQRTSLFQKSSLKLDCIDCYVQGSFKVTGHIKVKTFKPQAVTIDVAPSSFAATVKLEAAISASTSPESLGYQKDLFSAPVPDAGFSIPKIFNIGAIFSYAVGFNTSIAGQGVVDFGLRASLSDSSSASINVADAGGSSATGFDGTLTPLFDVKSLSASVTVAAFSKPKLSFGVELIGLGTANVDIGFKLPEVSTTLKAEYAAGGVCRDDPAKTKTGVESVNQVKLALLIEATLAFRKTGLPSWSRELWSKVFPLPGQCWPISIPGLGA